jgi:L-arabinose isomerase
MTAVRLVGISSSGRDRLATGGPHHTVLSQSVGIEELNDFAEMMDTELAVMVAGITARRFGNELRWNAAPYRLAFGIAVPVGGG